jgi:hypothetical protein
MIPQLKMKAENPPISAISAVLAVPSFPLIFSGFPFFLSNYVIFRKVS